MKMRSVTAANIFLVQRESQAKVRDGKNKRIASSFQWSYCSFYRSKDRWSQYVLRKKTQDPGHQTSSCLNKLALFPAGGDQITIFLGYLFIWDCAAVLRCFWAMFISACPHHQKHLPHCRMYTRCQVGMLTWEMSYTVTYNDDMVCWCMYCRPIAKFEKSLNWPDMDAACVGQNLKLFFEPWLLVP